MAPAGRDPVDSGARSHSNASKRRRWSISRCCRRWTDARVLAFVAGVFLPQRDVLRRCIFTLPTIIKAFGVTDTQTGLIAPLPFVFGATGMVLLGRHSDSTPPNDDTTSPRPWCSPPSASALPA